MIRSDGGRSGMLYDVITFLYESGYEFEVRFVPKEAVNVKGPRGKHLEISIKNERIVIFNFNDAVEKEFEYLSQAERYIDYALRSK